MEIGIQQDVVQGHLNGCSDCAEWSSLLNLLGSQPRVQAPADFDARLQARLASEEVKLLKLVHSLPPVKAPADFDFRLRGRLAQAKTAKAGSNPLAWLAEFWANSFSLGQAATAMAVVALIVAFSALQLMRNSQPPAAGNTQIAWADKAAPVAASTQVADTKPTARTQVVNPASRITHQAAPASAKGFVAMPASAKLTGDKLVTSNAFEQRVFDSAKRQETKMPRGRIGYGIQLAKYVPAPKAESMGETF